ncbi:hypothetical protein GCM10022225_07720 [Plantactinospora mayteni]|uniref:Fatty acid desaturase domain-containing protein n=1 Tax=Plantactinospora mayteni TaxID=566021 RepID=A0ABQ4EIA8_9ACTN|nr:fatty acid desaturase [Plantactinospora mayteni]GIG94482.1 hypothetical protein Pma05_10550 [Plantactinospora mayteni]
MESELKRTYARRSATRLAVTLTATLSPVAIGLLRPDLLASVLIAPLLALQVIGLTGVSNAAHESVHGHLFHRVGVDRFWGRFLHGLLLLNHDVHRRYHLTHHAFLGTGADTEEVFDFDDLTSREGYVRRVVRWSLPPSPLHLLNWKEGVVAVAGRPGSLGKPIRSNRAAAGFVMPALVIAALVTWTMLDPVSAILAGFLPLLVLFPLYTYLTALPEHFGLPPSPDGIPDTRNVRTWPVLQYLLWNFNLHAVHHAYPNLHFSLLPASLDKVEAPTADGYLRFHTDVIRAIGSPAPVPEVLGVR